jgi:hypothetical protein
MVVPTTLPVTNIFAPRYSVGNPATATTTPTVTSSTGITVFSSFASFVAQVNSTMTAAAPALQFDAMGLYNRATNTFTATSVNVVL